MLRYLSHKLQKNNSEIYSSGLTYNSAGKRKSGPPKQTWLSTTLKESGKSLNEMKSIARKTVRWEIVVKDLCPKVEFDIFYRIMMAYGFFDLLKCSFQNYTVNGKR